jgi:hypothetical protein
MIGVDQQHGCEVERCGELPRGMPGDYRVRRVFYMAHLPVM